MPDPARLMTDGPNDGQSACINVAKVVAGAITAPRLGKGASVPKGTCEVASGQPVQIPRFDT